MTTSMIYNILMAVQIAPETEHRLTEAARRQGISVDALLDQLLVEEVAAPAHASDRITWPTYDLGEVGSLHRRDIYDDVP
jgi:hypothetical protein